ncbi:MAG: large-conductance mechanosensitive channel protein MscL [Dehalococcoidales bacterium]
MLKDFKAFIMRGNVVDMAVGIIIGAAFGAIVTSLVSNVIMPPIGLALGKVDFANLLVVLKQGSPMGPYLTLADAQAAHAVTINYGTFINTVISFIIVAAVVFFLIVRPIAKMNERQKAAQPPAPPAAPTTKECAFCGTQIPIKATRCPNCTSELTK